MSDDIINVNNTVNLNKRMKQKKITDLWKQMIHEERSYSSSEKDPSEI